MRTAVILLAALLIGSSPAFSSAEDTLVPAATLHSIYNSMTPKFGPANAVTIVEFYDYQCGYCKASEVGIEKLLQEDGPLRIIYMDFPKLGPLSVTAATVTLASMMQGSDKYFRFHTALMRKTMPLSEDVLFQTAQDCGLDVAKLKQDMNDPAIAKQIQDNIALGKSAGVQVTPDFIVGGHFFPGYAQYDQLKQMVDYARAKGQGR